VEIEGVSTAGHSDRELTTLRHDTIGFIFQSFNLIPVLDVFENIEFPLLMGGNRIPKGQRREWVDFLVAEVGLEQWRDHKPNELSGGQRQRVAIARALVVDPKLVIADEPTANLDSENSRMVVDLMREMNRARKVTFVFTTHDQRLLDHVDRKILLRDGNIVSDEVTA